MEINARTQPGVRVRVTCPNTNKQVLGTLRSVMPSSTPGCWVARIDPDDKDHPIQPITLAWRGVSGGISCEEA